MESLGDDDQVPLGPGGDAWVIGYTAVSEDTCLLRGEEYLGLTVAVDVADDLVVVLLETVGNDVRSPGLGGIDRALEPVEALAADLLPSDHVEPAVAGDIQDHATGLQVGRAR